MMSIKLNKKFVPMSWHVWILDVYVFPEIYSKMRQAENLIEDGLLTYGKWSNCCIVGGDWTGVTSMVLS